MDQIFTEYLIVISVKLMRIFFIILSIVFSLSVNSQGPRSMFWAGKRSGTTPTPPEFQWSALTPQSPTYYGGGCGTILVENKSFTNMNPSNQNGANVKIEGDCNITFKNCYFGPSKGVGAYIRGITGTGTYKFINCLFASNSGGVFGEACSGINIQIENCEFVNPWGARNCRGQMLQLAFFNNSPNTYFIDSRGESFRGEGYTEDWLSNYNASGISSNYIVMANNMVRGGGPSTSGGGFIAGDGDGRYITIENNKLYNPGNYIIAAAGGGDIIIRNNMGYQEDYPWRNIAMYAFITNASTFCNNITMTGNSMLLPGSGNYYCYCSPYCGDVIGIDESQGNPTNGWLSTNAITTLAQINFPTTLITFVDEDRLWHIRDESTAFTDPSGFSDCPSGKPAQLTRPTSNAGSNQSIGGTSATLNGSGSTSTDGFNYQWVFVSGPTTPTIVSPFTQSTSVTGMSAAGVYEFRLVVTNNSGAADADWIDVTK